MKKTDDERLDRVKKIGFLVAQAFAAVVVIVISAVGHLDSLSSLLALILFLIIMGFFALQSYRRIVASAEHKRRD